MNSKGFTLVELLLAMTLLLLLIGSSTWSQRFYTQQWERLSRQDSAHALNAVQLQELTRVFASTSSYVIQYAFNQFGFYWKGNAQTFTGVAQSSLLDSNRAAVYKVSILDQNDRCILLYQETSITTLLPKSLETASIDSDYEVSIPFEGECGVFEYLGWEDQSDRGQDNANSLFFPISKAVWLSEYDGTKNLSIPAGIRFSINNQDNAQMTFKLASTLSLRVAAVGGVSE